MRALAPILVSLALALGACGGDPVDDVKSSVDDVAADVRKWANAHTEWSKALNTASDSEVAKLAGEQVAAMRKAAKSIAEDVQSLDDEDLKKSLEPMSSAVDELQRAAEDVVDALRDKGQDAYLRALVAYQRVAAEAARRQRELTKILDEKLGKAP